MISLERLPAPAGALRCLLCEGIQGLEEEGGTVNYERHLRTEHGVSCNRSWLIEQTLVTDQAGATRQADLFEQQELGESGTKAATGESNSKAATAIFEMEVTDHFVTVEAEADRMVSEASVVEFDPLDLPSVDENGDLELITEVAGYYERSKRKLDVKKDEDFYISCKKPKSLSEDKCQNTEVKQTHQTVKKLVKSALRGCNVTLRNFNFKHFKDLTKDLSIVTDENGNERKGSDLLDSCPETVSDEEYTPEELLLNTSNEPKSGKGVLSKHKSRGIKITKTLINLENGTGDFKPRQDNSENASDWFDGNKFTCKKCMFASTSLNNFSNHVKCYHKTTLAKFSGCYGKTNVQYQCQCCVKKVYHEKSVIKEHVEGHLLNLKKYTSLYEKGVLRKKSVDKTNHQKLSSDYGDALTSNSLPTVQQDISLTSDAQSSPPPSPPTAAPPPPPPPNELASTNCSASTDKFVYICPFPGCDFQTDFQGMKDGPAAEHGIAVHQIRPWEVKKHGLKWKRKRQVCGED